MLPYGLYKCVNHSILCDTQPSEEKVRQKCPVEILEVISVAGSNKINNWKVVSRFGCVLSNLQNEKIHKTSFKS